METRSTKELFGPATELTREANHRFQNNLSNITEQEFLENQQSRLYQSIIDILESISDVFLSFDREFRITYWNKAAEQLFNLKREQVLGRVIGEIFPLFSRSKYESSCKQAANNHQPLSFETYSSTTGKWLEVRIFPSSNNFSAYLQDITKRKLSEQALAQSEEKFAKAFYNNPDIMAIATLAEGRYIEVNDAFEEIAGYKREETIGHTAREMGLWIDLQDRDFVLGELFEKGYMRNSHEVCFRTKCGEIKPFLVSSEIIYIDGMPHVLWVLKDISKLKRSEEALRQSEERFYMAFQFSPMMMTIINLENGRYIEVNQKCLDTTEYNREDIIGHSLMELGIFMDLQYLLRVQDVLKENGVINLDEHLVRTRSGKMITVVGSVVAMRINGTDCALVTVQDISEKKEMESNLARLDQLNLVGEMAASIGHEIRNPMTSIRGFLQMLNAKGEYAKDACFFDLMIEELDRANAIISEFLGMAKDKRVDLKPQYLDDIVKSIYPMIQADANYMEMDVELDLCKPPIPLIDAQEVRQMILNMARNGLEAMSPGGILTIGTRSEENEIVLFIKDQGSGLDPNIIAKIGTPFITTKEKGTGLGLAVCYSIAARHKARINFNTGPQGTTFYVRFPKPPEQASLF